jgi:hypothetical protein
MVTHIYLKKNIMHPHTLTHIGTILYPYLCNLVAGFVTHFCVCDFILLLIFSVCVISNILEQDLVFYFNFFCEFFFIVGVCESVFSMILLLVEMKIKSCRKTEKKKAKREK